MIKRLVDVGGYRLSARIAGSGTPAIVLEAPLAGSKWVWKHVWRQAARLSTVVVYDRAGMGDSEPGPLPRTALRSAEDLERLIRRFALPPPYVLVGHSYGGLVVQVFARRYPKLVGGVVLVDSGHPAQYVRLEPYISPAGKKAARAFRLGDNPEHVDLPRSEAHARRPGAFPAVPLRVLSSPIPVRAMAQFSGHRRQARQTIGQLDRDLAALSPEGRLVKVKNTGHFIQLDRPEVVIESIRQVILQARASGLIARSGAPAGEDRRGAPGRASA